LTTRRIGGEKFVEVNTVKFIQLIEQKSLRYFLNPFVPSIFLKVLNIVQKNAKVHILN